MSVPRRRCNLPLPQRSRRLTAPPAAADLGGYTSGIPPEAWDTLRRNKIFLKAPITTPTGGGAYQDPSPARALARCRSFRPRRALTPRTFYFCPSCPLPARFRVAAAGYKSLNVSIRKTLGLYANVRPCIAYSPFIQTHHPDMDLVIVRENEEGALRAAAGPRGTETTRRRPPRLLAR